VFFFIFTFSVFFISNIVNFFFLLFLFTAYFVFILSYSIERQVVFFLTQETTSLFFLFLIALGFSSFVIFIIFLTKIALAPINFWLNKIIFEIK